MTGLRRSYPDDKKKTFKKEVIEFISLLLLVGVVVFGVRGALILGLRTTSPMFGISSGSMEHSDDHWQEYFLKRNYDPSDFPFQQGLQKGDLVFIRGVDSLDDVQVGDVIVFHSTWGIEDRLIIHRIADVNRSEGYVITKGDANPNPDPEVIPLEAIRGKAIFSIPYLGYPSTIIRGEG